MINNVQPNNTNARLKKKWQEPANRDRLRVCVMFFKFKRVKMKLGLSLAISILMSSCAAPIIVGGIGGAAYVVKSDRGVKGVASDLQIKGEIQHLWFGSKKQDVFKNLSLTVESGKALVSGTLQHPEDHIEAIRLAWDAKHVKEVIDEIKVGKSQDFTDYALDAWITTQAKNSILWEKNVNSTNYNISTINKSVYVMGIAESQDELDRVLAQIRHVKDVKNVVSYVKLKE